MKTTPKTMWCTCRSPGVKLPGHQRTSARMSRTDSRVKLKLATKATKKQNSGSRPVCTICVANQPDIGRLYLLRRCRDAKRVTRLAAVSITPCHGQSL
jgi:hypothetical protein